MKYHTSFLASLKSTEVLDTRTDKADRSPGTPESTGCVSGKLPDQPDHAPVEAHGTCQDCGRPSPILLVTDYGGRYCRDCITFPPKKPIVVTAPIVPAATVEAIAAERVNGPARAKALEARSDALALELNLYGKAKA